MARAGMLTARVYREGDQERTGVFNWRTECLRECFCVVCTSGNNKISGELKVPESPIVRNKYMDSFSVRCIFLWEPRPDQKSKHLYEERITLWHAESLDHAIELAEQEAEVYAEEDMKFLGYSLAYALYDEVPVSGVEVFSLLRDSDLEPEDYLDAFFDTGKEHARK